MKAETLTEAVPQTFIGNCSGSYYAVYACMQAILPQNEVVLKH